MEEEAFKVIIVKIESIPDQGYRSALKEAAILVSMQDGARVRRSCRRVGYAAKARVRITGSVPAPALLLGLASSMRPFGFRGVHARLDGVVNRASRGVVVEVQIRRGGATLPTAASNVTPDSLRNGGDRKAVRS